MYTTLGLPPETLGSVTRGIYVYQPLCLFRLIVKVITQSFTSPLPPSLPPPTIHTRTHSDTYTHAHAHTRTRAHTHTRTHTHAHTHTHTHTRTHTRLKLPLQTHQASAADKSHCDVSDTKHVVRMVVVAEHQLQLSVVVAVLTGRRLPEAIKCVQMLRVADAVPGPTGRVGHLTTEAEVEEG